MPIVQVSLMEGRPSEKIEKMVSAVSEAVATSLEAPIETVRVIVYEMQPHQYGIGGKPYRVVQEERKQVTT
jgi:4-oxalocrotonate tautomerase